MTTHRRTRPSQIRGGLSPASRSLLITSMAIAIADWRDYQRDVRKVTHYDNASDLTMLACLLDDFDRDALTAKPGDEPFTPQVHAAYELVTRPSLRQAVLDLAQEQYA